MGTLSKRLADLESKQSSTDLRGLSADQLDAHIGALQAGTFEWFRVLIAGIQRRGSRLPLHGKRSRMHPNHTEGIAS